MTDVVNLGCVAYVVGRLGERGAVSWCGCRSERHGIVCGQNEVSRHFCMRVAAGGGGERRSD